MTVLVTGGAGYIGSHMAHLLSDRGEPPVILDNLSTGFDWAIPADATLVVGDIADKDLLDRVFKAHGITAVIHFAGSIIVPESVDNPLKYYHNNTAKTRTLIEACVYNDIENFIFSSTAAVYGMPEVNPITEEERLLPISPYGTSKLMSELMMRDCAAAYPFRYVALRYFNVAGADPKLRCGQSTKDATHLIKVANQVALGQRDQLSIYGTDYPTADGTCIRDYIHVTDLAEAHYLALQHLRAGGEALALNCGYGHGFSVREVVETLEAVIGRPIDKVETERRAGDPPSLVADSGQLRARFGWEPAHDDLAQIIRHALDWEEKLSLRNRA
ncbi:MAG: UDP-glucose 4-epimerase GalE [Pseudomonadota bacterium]